MQDSSTQRSFNCAKNGNSAFDDLEGTVPCIQSRPVHRHAIHISKVCFVCPLHTGWNKWSIRSILNGKVESIELGRKYTSTLQCATCSSESSNDFMTFGDFGGEF